MPIIVKTEENRVVLKIESSLTINNVAEAHRRILEGIADARRVTLDLSGLTGADAAGVQLIGALKKSCESRNVPFELSNAGDTFQAALKECGIAPERMVGMREDG